MNSPSAGRRKSSIWILESGLGTTDPLQRHVECILEFVGAHAGTLAELSKDCSMDVFCGYSSGSGQGGFEINHEALKKLGEAGIDLVLDLYPPERSD